MEKFLLFVDAADDAAMFPVSRLQSVTCATDGEVNIKFSPGSLGDGQAASVDMVRVAITADKEKEVMTALGDEISLGNTPVILVSDDVNGTFLTPDITGCALILDA